MSVVETAEFAEELECTERAMFVRIVRPQFHTSSRQRLGTDDILSASPADGGALYARATNASSRSADAGPGRKAEQRQVFRCQDYCLCLLEVAWLGITLSRGWYRTYFLLIIRLIPSATTTTRSFWLGLTVFCLKFAPNCLRLAPAVATSRTGLPEAHLIKPWRLRREGEVNGRHSWRTE